MPPSPSCVQAHQDFSPTIDATLWISQWGQIHFVITLDFTQKLLSTFFSLKTWELLAFSQSYFPMIVQRVLNRWSKLSEQKLRFFPRVKIWKNAFNKKWWAYRVYISQKKSWSGCHHLLLVYDASKLSTVYVVKSPAFSLQRAFFQKS